MQERRKTALLKVQKYVKIALRKVQNALVHEAVKSIGPPTTLPLRASQVSYPYYLMH